MQDNTACLLDPAKLFHCSAAQSQDLICPQKRKTKPRPVVRGSSSPQQPPELQPSCGKILAGISRYHYRAVKLVLPQCSS